MVWSQFWVWLGWKKGEPAPTQPMLNPKYPPCSGNSSAISLLFLPSCDNCSPPTSAASSLRSLLTSLRSVRQFFWQNCLFLADIDLCCLVFFFFVPSLIIILILIVTTAAILLPSSPQWHLVGWPPQTIIWVC